MVILLAMIFTTKQSTCSKVCPNIFCVASKVCLLSHVFKDRLYHLYEINTPLPFFLHLPAIIIRLSSHIPVRFCCYEGNLQTYQSSFQGSRLCLPVSFESRLHQWNKIKYIFIYVYINLLILKKKKKNNI